MPNTEHNETGTIFVIACILLSIWGVVFVQAIRVKDLSPVATTNPTSTDASVSSISYPWVTYFPVAMVQPSPSPTSSEFPWIQAQSALLFDFSQDTPLLAYRASLVYPIASITKLMTGLLVSEQYGVNASTTLVVEGEDLAVEYPSKILVAGDELRISEAVRILLIGSDNSVAHLLARHTASTTDAFVRRMNVRAYSFGMTNTRFVDPIGFSGNVSTAFDLVSFIAYVLGHNSELLRISSYPSLTLILGSGKAVTIQNTNILADKIPGFIGGKTGFLDEAGGSLVSVFKIRDKVLATVILGSPDRFGDTTQLIQWYLKQPLQGIE